MSGMRQSEVSALRWADGGTVAGGGDGASSPSAPTRRPGTVRRKRRAVRAGRASPARSGLPTRQEWRATTSPAPDDHGAPPLGGADGALPLWATCSRAPPPAIRPGRDVHRHGTRGRGRDRRAVARVAPVQLRHAAVPNDEVLELEAGHPAACAARAAAIGTLVDQRRRPPLAALSCLAAAGR